MANDDWDLGAMVGICRRTRATSALPLRCPFASFPPSDAPLEVTEEAAGGKGGSFLGFPDLSQSRDGGGRELEELCKPFFSPKVHQQQFPALTPIAGPLSITPASAVPLAAAEAGPAQPPPTARQPHRPLSQMPRSKRRRNQQKKVVCHVPAAGLADVWAWRKYGQKPIKGSPYPRGYYRCSSSKGCLARKQVERSRTDPAMFIITYTAEHNHPVPTHRNSLAGSTRHKFPSSAPAAAGGCAENPSSSPPSSSTAPGLSPTTPLTASVEDELLDEDEGMLLVENMEVMGEDDLLFTGVEDEAAAPADGGAASAEAATFFGDDGGLGDHFFAPPWLSKSSNAAAAAGGG